jgi:LemA protein
MSDSLIVIALVAVLLFWTVGAYNRLVRLRSQALQAFGALAVHLRRVISLAQSSASAATRRERPAADAGGAEPLDAMGTAAAGLDASATQCLASLQAAKARPLDAEAIAALAAARGVLAQAWKRLSEEPEDLAGAPLPESLGSEWEQIGQQVAGAADEFNQAVQRYNEAVGQFPALVLAWVFGFRVARPL